MDTYSKIIIKKFQLKNQLLRFLSVIQFQKQMDIHDSKMVNKSHYSEGGPMYSCNFNNSMGHSSFNSVKSPALGNSYISSNPIRPEKSNRINMHQYMKKDVSKEIKVEPIIHTTPNEIEEVFEETED